MMMKQAKTEEIFFTNTIHCIESFVAVKLQLHNNNNTSLINYCNN